MNWTDALIRVPDFSRRPSGLMIVSDREGWSVLGSVDEVRQTVATALDSGNEGARSDAIVVLNLLGAREMSEFRDLMPRGGS